MFENGSIKEYICTFMIFHEKDSVHINSLGKHFCKSDWVWDLQSCPFKDFDLWFILGGRGRLSLAGHGEHELQGGDCFLFEPGMTLHADNDCDEPLTVIYTHFDLIDQDGDNISNHASGLPESYCKIPDPVFFTHLLHRMLDCFYRNDRQTAERWLIAALMELSRAAASGSPLGAFSRISEYIRSLYTKINEHPEINYSLRKQALKAGYSPEHFSRLFREHTGMSFRACIMKSRMNQAQAMLSATQYSIGQIAGIVGCRDIFLFSRLFRKHVGVSPSEYRARARERNHT